MVTNKQIEVKQRKSGRKNTTTGTCKNVLDVYSLLRETSVGELPKLFSFHVILKTAQLTKPCSYQEQESFL